MAIRVLMVDDDTVHLELSERFLKRQSPDYEIVSVETSDDAIRLLEENGFDAAVCDIDLAEQTKTGLNILEHVRSRSDDIPFIIFTGKSREEFAIQALNLGADYYIRKSSTNIEGLYAELSYYILTAVAKRRTERALRDSEQKLRESEARLAEAQRISHSGSWVWNIVENKEIWSDEIYRIFGLAPQEFLATYEAFLESVHPEDRELVKNSVEAAIKNQEPYSIDHRIVRPDGAIRHVHEEGEVTFDADGTAVRMMGTVQDTTDRIIIEELLREERDRARKYLQLTNTMIVALDTSFNVTMINRKGCEILEYTEEEILGKNWIQFFLPESGRNEAEEYLKSLLDSNGNIGPCCSFKILTRTGTEKTILCHDTVLFDDEGDISSILCSAQLIPETGNIDQPEITLITQSLRAREEWWQGVFDHAPGAIGIFNSEGLLIDANKAAVEMLGVKNRETLLGLSLFRDSNLPKHVLESVQRGEVHRFDYKWDFGYVSRRGILPTTRTEVIYMDVVLSPLQDTNGQSRGYVLHATDMTHRRRTEQALKANEEMFRTIFDESPICIELFDSDGIQIGANKASLELFGQESIEDSIGFDLFGDPNTPDFVKEHLRKGAAVKAQTRFDFSKVHLHDLYKTKKTGILHLDAVFSPLHYGSEEGLQGYIIHIQDITDRHLAEQALMESRESYKELYNNALIGLFRVRISDSMILECNEYFAKIFSHDDRQSIIDGMSFFKDFLLRPSLWNELKETLKKQERVITELQVTSKDSKKLWMRFSLRIATEKGHIEGVMSDITQQKLALEMLRNQKEELSEFAHSMSHDLKNILHNMQGFLELAEDENNLTHLKRLHSLINDTIDLLNHSVLLADAGLVVEEDLTDVNLDVLVRDVAESIIPDTIGYNQDSLPVVKADVTKVSQIFRNLFDNAVKHGKPRTIEVRSYIREGNICVAVSNDGKDISDEIRPKLFSRGFTTSKTGQGFGLSIVKRIAEAHKWTIHLVDTKKTTFELRMPINNSGM
ncbi:MAG: PAS domain S-box protein [Candidatus Thorarchaeota archaeon]|nr:PAS domain S-box protein [Candidatus Thorarchaeota archaeon]